MKGTNMFSSSRHSKISNLSTEKANEIINKTQELIPDIYELSENQDLIINNLIHYIKVLRRQLKPLKTFGLEYNFGIGGGIIRDLVLDKSPGDVDIIVNIPMINPGQIYLNYNGANEFYDKIKNTEYNYLCNIGRESSPYYSGHDRTNYFLEIKTKNYMKFIKQLLEIKGKYHLQDDGACANYQNAHIIGIIKQNFDKNLLPADIIFSSFDIENYVNTFDFDLCKGYISSENLYELSTSKILKSIILSPHMIRDIENKQMTMNLANLKFENVEYYLNKHFLKMKEKFPDYELNTRVPEISMSDNKVQELSNLENYVRSVKLKNKLEESIDEKIISTKKLNKI